MQKKFYITFSDKKISILITQLINIHKIGWNIIYNGITTNINKPTFKIMVHYS